MSTALWRQATLAIWFGLVTGLADVAVLGIKKFYLGRAVRFGPDVVWMAPLSSVCVFLLIGALLVLAQRMTGRRPASTTDTLAVSVYTFFSALTLLLTYYPVHIAAKILLAAGIAVQAGRIAARRSEGFRSLVNRGSGVLAAVALAAAITAVWTSSAPRRREASTPPAGTERPNVLLIVLDTVRAKNMSVYGYRRPTTPNLQQWATSGVVFDRATSTSPWTLPSHASMFTGRWPWELSANWDSPLDDRHPTLAEALSESGYRTAGFVANTHYCGYEFGLNRGFARYEDYNPTPRELLISSTLVRSIANSRVIRQASHYYDNIPRKNAYTLTNDFLDWLPETGGKPFFAFLNYFDAHEVYLPPRSFADAFGPEAPRRNHLLIQDPRRGLRHDWPERPAAEIKAELDMYDASIAYIDSQLGRLFDELRRRGLLDSTVILLTADHGEQFGEHRLFLHGNSLYAPLLDVPLMMWFPPAIPPGRRVPTRVSLRDIPATVQQLAGVGVRDFPGASLARYWSSGTADATAEPVLAQLSKGDWGRDWYPMQRGDMSSLMDDRFHYIRNGDGREELFDLAADADELQDLSQNPAMRETLARFRAKLDAMVATGRR